jgi:hypothetical protein
MEDKFGLVPPEIRRMHEADEYNDRAKARVRGVAEALRALKPSLELVYCKPDSDPSQVPFDALPGFWHVRDNDAQPVPKLYPITGAKGEYREPDSAIVTELAQHDMRRPDVADRVFGASRRAAERRKREKALKDEQWRDEMVADVKAGLRVNGRIYRDDGSFVKRKVA